MTQGHTTMTNTDRDKTMTTEPIIIRDGASTRTERELVAQLAYDAADLIPTESDTCNALGDSLIESTESVESVDVESVDYIAYELEDMLYSAGYIVEWCDGYIISAEPSMIYGHKDVIGQVSDQRRALATHWHSGQSSPLYAISSTGKLLVGRTHGLYEDEWRELAESYLVDLRLELVDVINHGDNDDADLAREWLGEVTTLLNQYADDDDDLARE